MRKYKRGFTLVELMVSLAILVILFIAIYDLYIQGLSLYKKDEQKAKAQIEVKNFSDTIYSYLKASYQNSIEVGTSGKLENVKLIDIQDEQNSIFMVVTQKGDPVDYRLSNYIEKNEDKYSYRGMLGKIMTNYKYDEINHFLGNNCTSCTIESKYYNKYYHYIMFTLKEENGEKYIETISNITDKNSYDDVKNSFNNMPGGKTRALSGIVEGFKIKPEYVQVNENAETKMILSKIRIEIDYKYNKNKTDKIILDYTIRN